MGRDLDGSYAEYTVIPRQNVFALQTTLPWEMLGALPEMLQTTHGSLYTALQIEHAENLLVRGGTVCMTGILGGEWVLPNFNPLSGIPTAVNLTTYSGEATDISESKLQEHVDLVESGKLTLITGPVFRFEQLLEAHRRMGEDTANGKIVIVL
jgi:NADPH:quinone reductase-like Zn-dependent oxidoreductase